MRLLKHLPLKQVRGELYVDPEGNIYIVTDYSISEIHLEGIPRLIEKELHRATASNIQKYPEQVKRILQEALMILEFYIGRKKENDNKEA